MDPNIRTASERYTPLHMAAYLGSTAIAARLLQREDTDIWARSIDGELPLDIALAADHRPMVRLLLKANDGREGIQKTRSAANWQYLVLLASWHHEARA